jgi:AcrR family transcriptional regulator
MLLSVGMAGTHVTSGAAGPATGERRRAAHLGPERRRPLILDAAFQVFLEHGYDGTSMEAIAHEAGVSKPVVYACFPSKEELFTALLTREEQRILGQIAAAMPERADEDIERTLTEALTAFLRAVADSPAAYRVIYLGEGGHATIAERVQRARAAQVDVIAALAETWLRQHGAADPADKARLIAYGLIGAAESAARALLAEPDRWDADTIGPEFARLMARGRDALTAPAPRASDSTGRVKT